MDQARGILGLWAALKRGVQVRITCSSMTLMVVSLHANWQDVTLC